MNISKKLYISNIITYLSFIIYSTCSLKKEFQGISVIFAFLPYLTVLYTTFIFNIKVNKNLKKVLSLSISDFIIRVIALFVNFYMTTTEYGDTRFKIVAITMIVLFAFNLFIEHLIELKLEKIEETIKNKELTVQEIIYNGSEGEIFKEIKSFRESIFLAIIIILILGYNSSLTGSYIVFYGVPFIVLGYIYIKSTYKTLFNYYKNKDKVIRIFLKENLGILLMLVLMIIYGFLKNGNQVKDLIIYLVIYSLSLPRYFSRRKRLKEVYENHMTRRR